jgi:hypothetical protein
MAAQGKQNLARLIGRAFGVIVRNLRALFNHVKFQIWALWAIGPVFILIYGAQLASVLGSAWPMSLRGEQLRYVGVGSWISLAIIAASALLLANVIKKISVQVGAAEFEFETITTVTETEPEAIAEEESKDGTSDDPR